MSPTKRREVKHLDLFSGIGGFALATERVWPDIVHTFVEIDPFCREVLKKHWPKAKIHEDIKSYKGETADIITGGFPCQPFSQAGKRKGSEDDRHLWPEMLRVIRASNPEWVIGENVGGLVTWDGGVVLDTVISDLEAEGYGVWPLIIPACAVNAIHRRDRVWILAHNESKRRKKGCLYKEADTKSSQEACRKWNDFWVQPLGVNTYEFRKEDEPFICGMDDGVPNRVDRLKGLGNAIVPQVAEQIFKAIASIKK